MERKPILSHPGYLLALGSVWGLSEMALGLGLGRCASLASGSIMTGAAYFAHWYKSSDRRSTPSSKETRPTAAAGPPPENRPPENPVPDLASVAVPGLRDAIQPPLTGVRSRALPALLLALLLFVA